MTPVDPPEPVPSAVRDLVPPRRPAPPGWVVHRVRAAWATVPEGSGEGPDVVSRISRHTGVKRRLVILALAQLRAEEAR